MGLFKRWTGVSKKRLEKIEEGLRSEDYESYLRELQIRAADIEGEQSYLKEFEEAAEAVGMEFGEMDKFHREELIGVEEAISRKVKEYNVLLERRRELFSEFIDDREMGMIEKEMGLDDRPFKALEPKYWKGDQEASEKSTPPELFQGISAAYQRRFGELVSGQ